MLCSFLLVVNAIDPRTLAVFLVAVVFDENNSLSLVRIRPRREVEGRGNGTAL